MSSMVCYIPSYNDSELARLSAASSPDWQIVISDNASAEPHASALAALASERVQVIRQPKNLGRVGNWSFCVRHFLDSGAEWMKFLCAGDIHKPNARDIFRRATAEYPTVRCIVPRMENVWPHRTIPWTPTDTTMILSCEQLLSATIQWGNIYHGLSAPLMHRETLQEGFSFGEDTLSYCADLLFMLNIAKRWPMLYYAEIAAEFIAARRKNLQAGMWTLEHFLEEGLMRQRAADMLGQITDQRRRNAMLPHVIVWLRAGLTNPIEKLTGEIRYSGEVLTGDAPIPPPPQSAPRGTS